MDNNDFFNNDGDNEQNENNAQDEDIFAEETIVDKEDTDSDDSVNDSDSQGSSQHYSENNENQQNQNAGQQNNSQNQNAGQQSWNRNRVNPDQWQAYRNGQQGNPYNNQYGPQGPYQQNSYQNYNGYYRPDNSKGFAIASLVLGIISLLCFCSFLNILPAVLAIVFGAISLSRRKDNALAIAGIVCAIVSLGLLVLTVVLFVRNADLMNAFQNYMNQYGNGFNYYFR